MANVVRTYSISTKVDEMVEQIANFQRRNKSVVIEMAIEELFVRLFANQTDEEQIEDAKKVEVGE